MWDANKVSQRVFFPGGMLDTMMDVCVVEILQIADGEEGGLAVRSGSGHR
jgi:hypothetical protein